jgi:protein-tyrosine phosphatase
VADYALTQEVMPVMLERWRTQANQPNAKEFPAHILRAEADTMRRLLAIVDEDYGSLAGYAAAGGVTDEVVEDLRSALLTS